VFKSWIEAAKRGLNIVTARFSGPFVLHCVGNPSFGSDQYLNWGMAFSWSLVAL
jgi:hypothetical protein